MTAACAYCEADFGEDWEALAEHLLRTHEVWFVAEHFIRVARCPFCEYSVPERIWKMASNGLRCRAFGEHLRDHGGLHAHILESHLT